LRRTITYILHHIVSVELILNEIKTKKELMVLDTFCKTKLELRKKEKIIRNGRMANGWSIGTKDFIETLWVKGI